jgi:hypothetical protein
MATQADIEAKNRNDARRFFWLLLILATATSLYGNIAHAVGGGGGTFLNGVIAACIAPVFLMALVHGIAHLARNTASGWAYGLVIASVGSVAAFAFAQSFGALTAFARASHVLAPGLTPLIVDATIGVSTFALVALGERPTRRARAPRLTTLAATSQVNAVASTAPASGGPHRSALSKRAPETPNRAGRDDSAPDSAATAALPASDGDATSALAARLVRDRATKQPLEIVHAVLAAHENGDPLNRISKDVHRHHSAVKRIIDAATAHHEAQQFAAVG